MQKIRILFLFALYVLPFTVNASNYYASPSGNGDGKSIETPFQISDFWQLAKPGDVLHLMDGHYKGSNSMITPPQGLKGTASQPITVRAINDGRVEIDGESVRRPVYLYYNDHFVLEGFNAHNSNNAIVELNRSNHNIVRRICAWDAGDVNTGNCFAAHRGTHNLFEDCAGWGTSRKVFTNSQGGDFTIFRRCWGSWEISTQIGPKMTYTFCYNSYNTIVENCIGTWNSYKMSAVDQPYGIFSMDRNDGNNNANSKLLGCIAYLKKDQKFPANQLYFVTKLNAIEIKDCLSYIEPETHSGIRSFALYSNNDGTPSNLSTKNLTSIGGLAPYIDASWKPENIYHAGNSSELVAQGGNILQTDRGADLTYRYENGVLTQTPLWPWPMNQRIIDAMTNSGREPVDVTKTVFELGGGTMPDFNREGSNNDPTITDMKIMKADMKEPVDSIIKGKWYDLYIYFNRALENWADLAFADIWLSSAANSSIGNISNRGGEFKAGGNYVMSCSISSAGIWAKETEGSSDWQNISGRTGLYIDDANNNYEINSAEGWAKVKFKVLVGVSGGSWTMNGYVKGADGKTSPLISKSFSIFNAEQPYITVATDNASQVVNGGNVSISIIIPAPAQANPGRLWFTDSQNNQTDIPLEGQLPGTSFIGHLNINTVVAEGVGYFSFVDEFGNMIENIDGKYLKIDRTEPSVPKNLTGAFSQN